MHGISSTSVYSFLDKDFASKSLNLDTFDCEILERHLQVSTCVRDGSRNQEDFWYGLKVKFVILIYVTILMCNLIYLFLTCIVVVTTCNTVLVWNNLWIVKLQTAGLLHHLSVLSSMIYVYVSKSWGVWILCFWSSCVNGNNPINGMG